MTYLQSSLGGENDPNLGAEQKQPETGCPRVWEIRQDECMCSLFILSLTGLSRMRWLKSSWSSDILLQESPGVWSLTTFPWSLSYLVPSEVTASLE